MGPCAGSARLAIALLLAAAAGAGCKTQPTTILLRIQADPKLGEVDELRLSVFDSSGAPIQDRRLPDTGRPTLPGEVVLYPHDSDGTLRLWIRARRQNAVVGDGATTAILQAGQQTEATVVIAAATLPDRDGDGIPDAVDNCPDLPNPKQGPCSAPDRGIAEAGPDGPRVSDLAREAAADLPQCDLDNDGHLAQSCGGDDCDDQNPLVHPKRKEGPPGDGTCSDGIDNDCDGDADLADTECRTCTSDAECDDKSVCTNDSCAGGQCKSSPANNGAICDDGNACTTSTTCSAGSCGGGAPVTCAAPPPCKTSSCDPAKGCVTQNLADGTTCSDGLYCTVGDKCTAGACAGAARDCQSSAPACQQGSCSESQDRCDYSPVSNGAPCSDNDPCTQGESCQSGSCKAPARLDEQIADFNVANALDRTIQVDSKGKVHLVVVDYTGGVAHSVRYLSNLTGAWAAETVGSINGTSSGYPSLVLDGSDKPHLVFTNTTGSAVQYARRAASGVGWTVSDLGPGQGPTSLAIDASGTLHVAHLSNQLQYAFKTAAATAWQTQTVSNVIKTPSDAEVSLALDAAGKPQIAFGDGADGYGGRLRHATMGATPASWTVVEPPGLPASRAAHRPSIAITPGGTVQIAHFSVVLSPVAVTLHLTKRVGTTWSSQVVGTATGSPQYPGLYCALTLDSQGSAQIAFRDSIADELRFVTDVSGTWQSTMLSKGGNVGRWLSLARAPSGRLHLLYEKETGLEVRHTTFSACP